ncbi:MAG: hypothetical protein AAF871_15740 [Pseudomonadota bacterium]
MDVVPQQGAAPQRPAPCSIISTRFIAVLLRRRFSAPVLALT